MQVIDPAIWRRSWPSSRVIDRTTGELLYVGCSNNVRRRVIEHAASGRYPRTDVLYQIEPREPELAALFRERRRILALRPRDNERI